MKYDSLVTGETESTRLISVVEQAHSRGRQLKLSDIKEDTLLPEGDAELQEYVDLYHREEKKIVNTWGATFVTGASVLGAPIAIALIPYVCHKEDKLYLLLTKLKETGKYKVKKFGPLGLRIDIVPVETPQ